MEEKSHGQGVKRPAEDELESEQRFAKRFSRLNLAKTGRAYVAVQPSHREHQPPINGANDELMQVDDTKDKVYITDLDAELADVDSEGEKLVFLPDIEKKISKIPTSVLEDHGASSKTGKEMILYKAPVPAKVSPEQDKARQTINVSRTRARQRQAAERQANGSGNFSNSIRPGAGRGGFDPSNLEDDVMEIG
ncbi:MAG: hypothetical protein M1837_003282 [Sclerophora amabilis]|nr:MAG: hypothetical protein M1837_003282 [Sclerophora amabilis]